MAITSFPIITFMSAIWGHTQQFNTALVLLCVLLLQATSAIAIALQCKC